MEAFAKIGIDWLGLGLYLINYGILFFILGYWAFPKILKVLDERRSAIKKNLSDAEVLRAEIQLQLVKSEAERKMLLNQIEQETATIRKELEQKKVQMMQVMENEKMALIEKTKKALAEEKAGLVKEVERDVVNTITKIILKVLSENVPEEVVEKSVQSAWKQLEKKL